MSSIVLSEVLEKYNTLHALIIKRQQFEKANPYPPYSTYQTDINFYDKDENTLLHYAAMLGDIDKIRYCIEGGASLDLKNGEGETAISLALIHDNLDAAVYLFDNKANCEQLNLSDCVSEEQEAWFKEKIATKSSQFITKQNTCKRAAEIGDIKLLDSVFSPATSDTLLVIAAANNQLEMMDYLLIPENKADINGREPFTNTALMEAITYHHEKIVDYLLSKNADIHKENALRRTACMIAVIYNNKMALHALLEKQCNLLHSDVDGNTILHLAVAKKSRLIEVLFAIPEVKTLVNQKNIYGDTPLDLAYRCKNDLAISLLAPGMDNFKEHPNYGHQRIKIAQSHVMKSMLYRLRLHYRSTEYFSDKGHCNGFAFLRSVYASQGMSQYYYDTLALMANWDGDASTLLKPLDDTLKQAKYYNHLDDLFEQWTNDITWFQHTKLNRIDSIKSADREKQYNLIKDKQKYGCQLFNEVGETLVLDSNLIPWQAKVEELMGYLTKMPKQVHFEIAGSKHITSAYINAEGLFDYYDPNFPYPTEPIDNLNSNVKRMIDYQYIVLSPDVKTFVNNHFQIRVFCFNQDLHALAFDQFEIFDSQSLPKSKADVTQFQSNSANRFTPLHIAVITRSLPCIKQLLLDGHCDLAARDGNRRTALDIALKNKFYESTALFINHAAMSASDIYGLYHKNKTEFTAYIMPNVSSILIAALFFKAIDKQDIDLIKAMFEKGFMDLNQLHSGETALHYAITHHSTDVCNTLLEMGASVDIQNQEGKTAIDLINESDDEQIKELFAENNLANTQFRM